MWVSTLSWQHTFIKAGDVRYLYQPLDDVYLLLITTKSSNIPQDAETLRLFSKVVGPSRLFLPSPIAAEALPSLGTRLLPTVQGGNQSGRGEGEVELIFAFDDGGLKEDVTPGQVRSYAVEMFSQEERLFSQIKLVCGPNSPPLPVASSDAIAPSPFSPKSSRLTVQWRRKCASSVRRMVRRRSKKSGRRRSKKSGRRRSKKSGRRRSKKSGRRSSGSECRTLDRMKD
jgi:hypothetical protein